MPDTRRVTGPRLLSRRYGRYGHGYIIDGEKAPGVSTILNALPKSLAQWASDQAANHAVEHWDELADLPLTKRLDRIRFAHRDVVSAAAARGTDVHRFAQQIIGGDPSQVPEELRGPVEAWARCCDRWQLEPVAVEAPVGSLKYRYGGRFDLAATVGVRDGRRALIDLKTGKNVYESVVLQLAAYRYADIWQPDGPASEEPLPPVDLTYCAHILPDDVRMLPVRADQAAFRQFLYVMQTAAWLDRHGFRGEEPLVGDSTRPEENDEEWWT